MLIALTVALVARNEITVALGVLLLVVAGVLVHPALGIAILGAALVAAGVDPPKWRRP